MTTTEKLIRIREPEIEETIVTLILVTLMSLVAHAGQTHFDRDLPQQSGPSLNEGDRFWVKKYDPKINAYTLKLSADETAGPLIASPEQLARGVNEIDPEAIKKAPRSIVDFDFTVDKAEQMWLLTDEQIKARRSAQPPKPAK